MGYGEALVRPKSTTRCGCTVLVWRNGCSWSRALSSAPCSGPQPGFGTCGLEAGADFCVEPPVVAIAVMPLLVLVLQPICESVFPLPTQAEGGTGGHWGGDRTTVGDTGRAPAPHSRPPAPGIAVPQRAPRGATPPGICRRRGRAARPRRETSRPSARPGTRCRWAACRSPVLPSCGATRGCQRGEPPGSTPPSSPHRPHLPRTVSPQ